MSFNNITRLTFGKRFVNSKGELDTIGKELKGVLSGRKAKINKANILIDNLPWLQWLLSPLNKKDKEEATMLNDRLDQFIREIIGEHAIAKSKNIGGTNVQHFVDSLLTLKDKYDLGEDTLFGLLWVRIDFDPIHSANFY